jgi:two-component system nitrogen regulation response regulator GlnG
VDPKRISDAALAWLEVFNFPGNVRQLENICHWLTVMAPAQMVEPKDLPPEVGVTVVQNGSGGAPPTAIVEAMVSTAAVAAVNHPSQVQPPVAVVASALPLPTSPLAGWELALEAVAIAMLAAGRTDVWDALTHRFESRLILAALSNTKGRRIEAAQKLGIGRNTITRKIQELGLE